jgi:hypothetical protein
VGLGGNRRLATTLVVTIEDQGTHGARLRELPDHPARCVGEEEGSVGVRGVGVCGTCVLSSTLLHCPLAQPLGFCRRGTIARGLSFGGGGLVRFHQPSPAPGNTHSTTMSTP